MRLSILLPMAAILVLGACAALQGGAEPEQNAQLRLDRGIGAIEAGRYTAAFDDLAWVYVHCTGYETGDDALAALAALELDPRNPVAHPAAGVELLGRMIRGTAEPSTRRLAETAFLASLALGAPHPDGPPLDLAADSVDDPLAGSPPTSQPDPHLVALTPVEGAGSTRECGPLARSTPDSTRTLPRLPGPSMAVLLGSAEAARDSVALRVDSLAAVLTATQEQLTATREELERIRKTLKP